MRVALYTRVSTDEQAKSGYSLDDQLARLEQHAASQGWQVVARVEDDGYSGTDPTRPGLAELVRLADEGAIDAVLATKRDRFYRSRLLRLATDEDLIETGVALIALDDTGNMIGDSVLDSFAEWERQIITERTMHGRLSKAQKDEVPGGGYAPYGFSWTLNEHGKRAGLVPNEDMHTVKAIFEMVARGDSLYQIVTERLKGVLTIPRDKRRAKAWNQNTIARIARNEVYKGVYLYGKSRVERVHKDGKQVQRKTWLPRDQWIAIPVADSGIPHDPIDKARQQLERRYRPRPKAQSTFELGGLLTCSECSCGITAFTGGRNKAGEPYRYYVCNKRKRHTDLCPDGPSWRAEKLEKIVARRVERLLQDPEQIKVRVDRAISEVATKDPTPWLEKIGELDHLESGYYDLAASGDMPKTVLREKLAALNEEREFARQQLGDSDACQRREDSLRATKDTLLSIYRDGLLYDGLSHFDEKIRREIYEALSLSGVLTQQGVSLNTEVTDHALRLTKAAQEWAEEEREWRNRVQYSGTPIGTVATTYNAVLRRPSAGERDTGENRGDIDTVAGRCTPLRDRRHTHRAEVPLAQSEEPRPFF